MDISKDILFKSIEQSNLAHTISSIEEGNELLYVNEAFLRDTGYTREEVIGHNCRFLQGEETDPSTVKLISHALRNFEPVNINILNYRKDGSPFWNHLKISTVYSDGKPIAFIGIQSDITAIINNEKIEQERYKLESLGRFSANISHEIKNAIQPIKLMTETLDDWKNLSPEQIDKCLNIAKKSTAIAENITKDVLAFSRQDGSDKESISTANLITDVSQFIENIIPNTITCEIKSTLSTTSPLKTISINRSLLYQVITNLVQNAIDSIAQQKDAQITVTFDTSTVSNVTNHHKIINKGHFLGININDNGEGIDESIMNDIFTPFFSTKSPDKGTGLGLAITRKILQENGGNITAQNTKNGACFTVYLPLTE